LASQLFTPLKIGPVEVPNRIAISPMCMYSADDGSASAFHIQHLSRFGMSGAGLAVMEATAVTREGRISPGCLGLYSQANEEALARVIAIAKKFALPGFKLGIQLCHAGRKASTPYPWDRGAALTPEKGAWQTVAPSPIAFEKDGAAPLELTNAQIEDIINGFGEAAKRAVRAGLDVIEIHAAHGYLIHQFLSPVSNHRTDDWGGTPEKRMRFALAVAKAVRVAAPSNIALGARINSTDFLEDGLQVEDAIAVGKGLRDHGFDYVCVSSGTIVPGGRPARGPGFNVERAARIKRETGLVTRTVGFIAGPKHAEEVVSTGGVDQVALARAFLDDSNWGWHAAEALSHPFTIPPQYQRVKAGSWPGAKETRAFT